MARLDDWFEDWFRETFSRKTLARVPLWASFVIGIAGLWGAYHTLYMHLWQEAGIFLLAAAVAFGVLQNHFDRC